jgi:hypothetical protein
MENLTVEQLSFAVATLENLVNARGLAHTQPEHLSGVKQSQISKILSRQADPSPEVLIKLFKAFGLTRMIQVHVPENGVEVQVLSSAPRTQVEGRRTKLYVERVELSATQT